jgi:hypothetical protein
VVALGMTKSNRTAAKATILVASALVLGTASYFALGATPAAPQAGNGLTADVSSCAQYHSIPNPCDPDSNN